MIREVYNYDEIKLCLEKTWLDSEGMIEYFIKIKNNNN